jgi:glutathione synthase/RimK-type ligase-like ATP-grasp enzyme
MGKPVIAVITNGLDVHADVVIQCLHNKGAYVHRLNTEDFPKELNLSLEDAGQGFTGHIEATGCDDLDIKQLTSVWYRRPEPSLVLDQFNDQQVKRFVRDESQAALANLYELTECFWVSPPDMIRKARHKLYQAQVAWRLGFRLPRTLVTTVPCEAERFYHQCNGQIVIKSLSGAQLVYDRGQLAAAFGLYTTRVPATALSSIESVRFCPVFLQEYIPKQIEIRTTVVGRRVFSAAIDSQTHPLAMDDWKRVNYTEIPHHPYKLTQALEQRCIKLVEALGLAFGAIDLILTPEGKFIFVEINPNGQWLWIEEVTCQYISDAVSELLIAGKVE